MLKIGHRGAKGHVAENTTESFLKAFELGADGIELDIRLSACGEAIVIHDETVDRTVINAAGYVKDFTVEDCRKVGIPTLVEVFHILPENRFLNIEIKDDKAVEVVVAEIEKFIRLKEIQYENIVVSSFNWGVLKKIRFLDPKIQLGVLTEDNFENAIDFAKEISAFSVNPYFGLLSSEKVVIAHKNKFQVHTWTVNSPEDIAFVKEIGVDAIISDYPERL